MQLRGESLLFFATDLTNFLGCRHLTAIERLAAHSLTKRPYFDDPMLEILRERGVAHERAYVEHLAAAGKRVASIERTSATPLDETAHAMREGVDVIVQARLEHGVWAGWPDVLLRVPGTSALGDWRYEPVETKLAKETRGATLVQLCLYAELLAELQGAAPEVLRVVVPESGFRPESYRFDEFPAWLTSRLVRRNFEADVQSLSRAIRRGGDSLSGPRTSLRCMQLVLRLRSTTDGRRPHLPGRRDPEDAAEGARDLGSSQRSRGSCGTAASLLENANRAAGASTALGAGARASPVWGARGAHGDGKPPRVRAASR